MGATVTNPRKPAPAWRALLDGLSWQVFALTVVNLGIALPLSCDFLTPRFPHSLWAPLPPGAADARPAPAVDLARLAREPGGSPVGLFGAAWAAGPPPDAWSAQRIHVDRAPGWLWALLADLPFGIEPAEAQYWRTAKRVEAGGAVWRRFDFVYGR